MGENINDSRKAFTDSIKLFVEYAKQQGSRNADKYYIHFSTLTNSCAGIKNISSADQVQIERLKIVQAIISNTINDKIKANKLYKDIFKESKDLCSLIKKGWQKPIIKVEYEQLILAV